jgi:UDP-N-acetylmuramate dehydrogenase
MNRDYLIFNDFDLKEFNTLRIEAVAQTFCIPYSINGMENIINDLSDGKEIVIIGSGSNILFSKPYYDSNYLFISTQMLNKKELRDGIIYAESGVEMGKLAWFALENSIAGFGFMEDIPGSVGGAIIMNAGTYEGIIGDLCKSVIWYDYTEKRISTVDVVGGMFTMRNSIFGHNNGIVLACNLQAKKGIYEDILEAILITKRKRYLKQPRNYPNAGSVFKTPKMDGKKFYVWQLFDELGLRGYSIGGAMVSEKHPGFIVNKGQCSSEDILKLLDFCKTKVYDNYGIKLELEWKLI